MDIYIYNIIGLSLNCIAFKYDILNLIKEKMEELLMKYDIETLNKTDYLFDVEKQLTAFLSLFQLSYKLPKFRKTLP